MADNTPLGFEKIKKNSDDSFEYMRQQASFSEGNLDRIEEYIEALEKFKENIENERLLSKKYRVISPYSNFPVEPTIQFYYSSESFTESHFTVKDLKKIDYFEIEKLYKKDPEYYNHLGHDSNWLCEEGGQGYWERKFNQTKFNNMIQNNTIVADFIKSNQEIKLSLIK